MSNVHIEVSPDGRDGSIRDYVSPDAMRWVPDNERDERPDKVQTNALTVQLYADALRETFCQAGAAIRAFLDALAEDFAASAKPALAFVDELKAGRRRQMQVQHRAYRSRQLARKRRRR